MKTKLHFLAAGSIVTALSAPCLYAIEPLLEETHPPQALLDLSKPAVDGPTNPKSSPAIGENDQSEIPYIGISTGEVPKMLSQHLDVPPSQGVIVRAVLPESPAHTAGLAVNDIILAVNETTVKSPENFTEIIRSYDVGDEIELSSIHHGERKTYQVSLEKRPRELAQQSRRPSPDMQLNNLPSPQADRIRDMIQRKMDQFGENPSLAHPGILDDPFSTIREQMNRAFWDAPTFPEIMENDGRLNFQRNSTVNIMDSQGSVEIQSHNDFAEVTVRDHNGDVEWSGPWNTTADKAKAPEEIKSRIEQVEASKSNGFTFRFGNRSRGGLPPNVIEN